MKLLTDAHVSRLIIDFLLRGAHDVTKASSFPPRTPDLDILRTATAEGRVVMTSDKDFGELVFRLAQKAVGVILLRIDVPTEVERAAVVEQFWPQIEAPRPGTSWW